MMWMATVHSRILVLVSGFDMQVSFYQVVPQADPHIKEDNFFGRPQSSKLDGRVVTVEVLNENIWRWSLWAHIAEGIVYMPSPDLRFLF